MADLLTLAEYRSAVGISPTNTRDDAKFATWLPMVSSAIRAFTERDFGAPVITESRTFEYDGSGFLDIDDASAVQTIEFTYPFGPNIQLEAESWTPKPTRRDDAPVYHYIEMPGYVGQVLNGSPEMGFTRNLDVYYRERGLWGIPSKVTVTATWGWPDVPPDVKLAAIWTMQEWQARPSGDGLTSEAIEGWSRTWGGRGGEGFAMAIPSRARDILVNYAKVN